MDKITTLILLFPCLLVGCTIHEYAHAFAARLCGDRTAEYMGRLTLNPIKHIDPIGTILLPVLSVLFFNLPLLMWAKPVPVNPINYKKPICDIWVALAGPASNVVLFLLVVFSIKFISFAVPFVSLPSGIQQFVFLMLLMNLVMAAFNMLPVPPLDGSSIVHYFFIRNHYEREQMWNGFYKYSFIVLFILIQFDFVQSFLRAVYLTPLRLAIQWLGI
ncbi:MAG: site-2 protease family protein [Candidatus Sumerlaeales bacterium]|mgnify:CR=1 FL=1|nr:site-2 protease family protein [Candidatus Sumerlaeales bacterium]